MKRLMDIILSAGLLVVLAPLLAVLAVAVKLSSPGPVFFRQERIGRFGVPFNIVKFRTMRTAAAGPGITVGGDDRITPVGRFLRAYKLDELPQLWNILKGEMSFVGPRPEVPEYVRQFSPEDMLIFKVRPGLTDYASIKYRNEEEVLARQKDPLAYYRQVILPDKLRLARQYVLNRSLKLDVQIMLWTITRILKYS